MTRLFPLALAALLAGCGQPANSVAPPAEAVLPDDVPPDDPPEPVAAEPTCEERRAEAADAFGALDPALTACTFDHECVAVPAETPCGALCPVALHTARRGELAPPFAGCGDCARQDAECARSTPRCLDGHCAMGEGDAPLREVAVPEANRAGQDPPPRPPPGEPEEDRARRLLAAIYADDPTLAQDFFFPREAFARVKAIADPDGYWQRLYARYATDVHALHEALALDEEPELVALDIIRRGGWVPRGDEGNALPYWVSRHSRLRYRVAGEERQFEVRVLITWGDRWYITHLSEFH